MTLQRLDVDALQERLPDQERSCAEHGIYTAKGFLLKTKKPREVWTLCPGCTAGKAAEEQRQAQVVAAAATAASLAAMLGNTALPDRFIESSFENYVTDSPEQAAVRDRIQSFAVDFDRHLKLGTAMIMSGQIGAGKTHLAAAVLRALLPRHVGAYVTMMSLMRMVRETWDRSSQNSEGAVIERLAKVPLLVVDEVGMQYGSTGELTIFTEIMDLRYRNVRPTILITNEAQAGFRTFVGDRVYDRTRQGGIWVEFDWPSFRKRAGEIARDAL